MKKFYTIKTIAVCAFAMLANIAVAQNLKVTANGKAVADGDTIELECVYEDLYGVQWEYSWNPLLEASTISGTENATITLTCDAETDGFSICWPMTCKNPQPGQSVSSSGTLTTEPSDLQIHREAILNSKDEPIPGAGSAKVTIVAGSDEMELTIKCLAPENAAVEGISSESNMNTEYYSIQGVRVAEPQKGQLIIERKGSKVTKRVF